MVTELPKVKIGNKTFIVDRRLNELRNVRDVSDTVKLSDLELAHSVGKRVYPKSKGYRCQDCNIGFLRERTPKKCPFCGSEKVNHEY